jgi:hypothetical protein
MALAAFGTEVHRQIPSLASSALVDGVETICTPGSP